MQRPSGEEELGISEEQSIGQCGQITVSSGEKWAG